jgi:hypothetical protein
MKRCFSHLGQVPHWAKCRLGNSASQTQQTESQQQVAAEEGVAVGAGSNNNTINVTTDDAAVTEAALASNTTVATSAITANSNVSLQAEDIAADEVDEAASTYAQQSELQSEETAAALQDSEQIAANAAPQTVAAENEIESGTSPLGSSGGISTSTVLVAIAALGLVYTLTRKS